MLFRKNGVIVFQGDSVTDAGRSAAEGGEFGNGYPAMCAKALQALYPDYNLQIFNRGIGGNRVEHLDERWQRDTMSLQPTLVTILIGINNVWHPFENPGTYYDIADFETHLSRIVKPVIQSGAKLVIMEPFAFHHGCFPEAWRSRLAEVNQVIRRTAMRCADAYIPLDGIFYKAALETPPTVLSSDGVHPTYEGHRLIAREWLKAVGAV